MNTFSSAIAPEQTEEGQQVKEETKNVSGEGEEEKEKSRMDLGATPIGIVEQPAPFASHLTLVESSSSDQSTPQPKQKRKAGRKSKKQEADAPAKITKKKSTVSDVEMKAYSGQSDQSSAESKSEAAVRKGAPAKKSLIESIKSGIEKQLKSKKEVVAANGLGQQSSSTAGMVSEAMKTAMDHAFQHFNNNKPKGQLFGGLILFNQRSNAGISKKKD